MIINSTAIVASPAVTFTIERYNSLANVWTAVLVSVVVATATNTVLVVGPALTEAANLKASTSVPLTWRVSAAVGDADALTYSVYAELN